MKFRSVSLFAVPFLVLTSFSPVFAATKSQTAKTFEHKSNSEQILLAGFFDDLGDEIKDSVEKEVNGIFNSEDNSTEKPQREDRDLQEQTQEEIQTSENEPIELEQLTNINPASTKAETGSAASDLTLFCNMDYATEAAEATSQSQIQSITSEARDDNCLLETEAGSELKYQYLGEEKYGIVLVGQNNNGQPYFGITKAKNIQTEEQLSSSSEDNTTASSESSRDNEESIKVEKWTLEKMKQILAKRSDETYEDWFHRTEKAKYGLYGRMIPKEQMLEWQNTLTGVEATEYRVRSEEIARGYKERGEIGDMVNDDVRDAFLSSPETGGEATLCKGGTPEAPVLYECPQ